MKYYLKSLKRNLEIAGGSSHVQFCVMIYHQDSTEDSSPLQRLGLLLLSNRHSQGSGVAGPYPVPHRANKSPLKLLERTGGD